MCEAESLSLQASLGVVGALERVVRRCLGPDGGSVLFTKDTGETVLTRHGRRILTTLHLDHPMARTVLECVCAHDRVTADGSKSFILLLAALLRGIHDSTNRHHRVSWSPATPRKLANKLLAFCWKELDAVVAHDVVPNASLLFGVSGDRLEGAVLPGLVGGYVVGRVGNGQADVLTSLLCELYSKVSQEPASSTADAITFLHSDFSLLHVKVPGLPFGSSQVVEGLVVARDWSVWSEAEGPVKALVVWESLDKPLLAMGDNVTICFQQDWLLRSEKVMERKLARLQGLQVSVVLSGVKQPECVLEWARLNGVSVLECCDSEQLDLLCELTAAETLPVHPLLRITTLTSYSRLQLGGCRYAVLGVPPHGSVQTHTLVLCAPTPGQLEQAACVSQGVFTMLQHLCRSVFRTREQTNDTWSLNDSHTHQIERDGDSLTHDRPHMSTPLPDRSQSPHSEQPRGPIKDIWDGILLSGQVLPMGGAFELLLHHSLLHCSNHGDSESRRLLAEAVLSVPRSLHSHRPRYFLQQRALFMSKLQLLKQGHTHGDPRSGSELRFGLGPAGSGPLCVEPICSKHQLVVSVLQCANRLLCVGTILHTRTPVHRSLAAVPGDSEEEDM
ncbi:Bardet-Biedl syndrome 10 protein [Salminus brasiliensis]|uniref:Bardet-Biedl syndrome 10 protein n=1 Tax=Salminus brasiliensis TaxID=930266 RepID=UPI003B833B4B